MHLLLPSCWPLFWKQVEHRHVNRRRLDLSSLQTTDRCCQLLERWSVAKEPVTCRSPWFLAPAIAEDFLGGWSLGSLPTQEWQLPTSLQPRYPEVTVFPSQHRSAYTWVTSGPSERPGWLTYTLVFWGSSSGEVQACGFVSLFLWGFKPFKLGQLFTTAFSTRLDTLTPKPGLLSVQLSQ